ncbi:hypothetical protein HK104_010395 [Borealophlyctis nickersoniae]|nr:hypothetical protein HK104_010395 [Borealophlyctis nickersoniae]
MAWALNTKKPDLFGYGTGFIPDPIMWLQRDFDFNKVSSLTKAKNGIFHVDLDNLKKKDATALGEVIDRPTILGISDGDHRLLLHLDTAVWGISGTNGKPRKRSRDESGKQGFQAFCHENVSPMLSKFDVILNLLTATDPQHDEIMSEHILWEAMGGTEDPLEAKRRDPCYVSDEEFTQWDAASGHRYIVSEVTGLRLSPDVDAVSVFTRKDQNDSLMLVEESMSFSCGVSVLGFTSLPQDQENIHLLYGDDIRQHDTVPDELEEAMDLDSDSDEPCLGATNKADAKMNRLYAHVIRVFDQYAAK